MYTYVPPWSHIPHTLSRSLSLTHTHARTRTQTHAHTCTHTLTHTHSSIGKYMQRHTGWRRLIGSPKLQIIFHKRAIKYRLLLRKMTCKDKGSYESWPPCTTTRPVVQQSLRMYAYVFSIASVCVYVCAGIFCYVLTYICIYVYISIHKYARAHIPQRYSATRPVVLQQLMNLHVYVYICVLMCVFVSTEIFFYVLFRRRKYRRLHRFSSGCNCQIVSVMCIQISS